MSKQRDQNKQKLKIFVVHISLLLIMFGVFIAAITSLIVLFSLISGIAWLFGLHPVSLFLFDLFK